MYFVDERLNLALYTFDLGTAHFEEVRRKIEAAEPPYDHPNGRDDSEDDAYQDAFENAGVAIQVIGMSCVELVQTALHVSERTLMSIYMYPGSIEVDRVPGQITAAVRLEVGDRKMLVILVPSAFMSITPPMRLVASVRFSVTTGL